MTHQIRATLTNATHIHCFAIITFNWIILSVAKRNCNASTRMNTLQSSDLMQDIFWGRKSICIAWVLVLSFSITPIRVPIILPCNTKKCNRKLDISELSAHFPNDLFLFVLLSAVWFAFSLCQFFLFSSVFCEPFFQLFEHRLFSVVRHFYR